MQTQPAMDTTDPNVLYSNSRYSTRMSADVIVDDHIQKGQDAQKQAMLMYRNEINVPYKDDLCMDIYQPEDVMPDAPIFIYVHGGFWILNIKEDGGHMALSLVKQGIITISVTHTLATKGTLKQIVGEVEESIVHIARKFPSSRGIFIGGHSSGGHLVAMMLAVDWTKHGLPQDIIKGVTLISAIYDVCPLLDMYASEPLKLTLEEAKKLSPSTYIKETCKLSSHCQIILLNGEEDCPPFKTQAREYGQQLKDGGLSVKDIVVKGYDHFLLLQGFSNDDYEGTKELIKMIKGQEK